MSISDILILCVAIPLLCGWSYGIFLAWRQMWREVGKEWRRGK